MGKVKNKKARVALRKPRALMLDFSDGFFHKWDIILDSVFGQTIIKTEFIDTDNDNKPYAVKFMNYSIKDAVKLRDWLDKTMAYKEYMDKKAGK